ncbi:hypothetical protein DICVIV_12048 [Dictyocaulus viviparus]|uniref:Uncharacterized protein n=1 Tax=Dictyocaulus viviparus TaxID=29172 RepID=A0A0D8XE74_DICVI|nr:hypothetical protein DICVIV_12048 [Dictyocaulus viviparus]
MTPQAKPTICPVQFSMIKSNRGKGLASFTKKEIKSWSYSATNKLHLIPLYLIRLKSPMITEMTYARAQLTHPQLLESIRVVFLVDLFHITDGFTNDLLADNRKTLSVSHFYRQQKVMHKSRENMNYWEVL